MSERDDRGKRIIKVKIIQFVNVQIENVHIKCHGTDVIFNGCAIVATAAGSKIV